MTEIDEIIEQVEAMPDFFYNEFRHIMNSFQLQINFLKRDLEALKERLKEEPEE
jgi:hypothetical protein